jgi:hypothetical protein
MNGLSAPCKKLLREEEHIGNLRELSGSLSFLARLQLALT